MVDTDVLMANAIWYTVYLSLIYSVCACYLFKEVMSLGEFVCLFVFTITLKSKERVFMIFVYVALAWQYSGFRFG